MNKRKKITIKNKKAKKAAQKRGRNPTKQITPKI